MCHLDGRGISRVSRAPLILKQKKTQFTIVNRRADPSGDRWPSKSEVPIVVRLQWANKTHYWIRLLLLEILAENFRKYSDSEFLKRFPYMVRCNRAFREEICTSTGFRLRPKYFRQIDKYLASP